MKRLLAHLRSLRQYPHLPICWERIIQNDICNVFVPDDGKSIYEYIKLYKRIGKEEQGVIYIPYINIPSCKIDKKIIDEYEQRKVKI